MALRINTNIASINAQRHAESTQNIQGKTFERLSSGYRVNHAADDAAGFAISDNLRGQIRGLSQAKRNANDGISLVQTGEGGLNEVGNMLIRLRELGVQGASDTIGDTERGFLNNEFQNLKMEIQRTAETTRYNGTQLLDGSGELLEVQVGINNNEFQDRIGMDTGANNVQLDALGLDDATVESKEGSQEVLAAVDTALLSINSIRATYGALQNRLESTINNLSVFHESLSAANSRIKDADVAAESAELSRGVIMQQASTAVLAQANSSPALALKLLG